VRRLAGLIAISLAACGSDPSASTVDTADGHTVDVVDIAPPLDTVAPGPDVTVVAPVAPVDAPFPVLLTADTPLTATVTVALAGTEREVRLYRGRGSFVARADAAGALPLTLNGAPLTPLTAEARPTRELSGALSGDELSWSAAADILVTGDVSVAAGDTLTIGAGTRVLVADAVNVEVSGAVKSLGTGAEPVLLTASGDAWGGLRLLPGAVGELDETWLVAGGGDDAKRFGHSDSQPVVWVDAARLTMRGGGILDGPGKAFGSRDADITLGGVRVARCDTGGELENTMLVAERLHVSEIPDGDGVADDDDNDGVYLRGARIVAGEAAESVLRDCVFAVGEDDGIDHNEALVRVERAWIEGFRHEGVAASNGRRITIVDSVVKGCEQGIEAGYGAPEVVVERCIVTGNGVGVRFGDSYDWGDDGTLSVTASVVYGNVADVRNFSRALDGPKPEAVTVSCSVVGDPTWVDVSGNVAGPPEGRWTDGCATGPALSADSCPGLSVGPTCAD